MLTKNNRVILGIPGITLISFLIIQGINTKHTKEISYEGMLHGYPYEE